MTERIEGTVAGVYGVVHARFGPVRQAVVMTVDRSLPLAGRILLMSHAENREADEGNTSLM
jgi:hypothetical protein